MNWEENARDYAQAHHVYEHRDTDSNYHGFRMFARGAKWQRDELTSDSVLEWAAKGMFMWDTDGHPDPVPTWDGLTESQRDVWRSGAHAVLEAALGGDQ